VEILKRSLDSLSSLKQFSESTRNDVEDLLASNQRVDYQVAGTVTVSRPNKLRGERRGVGLQTMLIYDGTTITMFDGVTKEYASRKSPGTLQQMFVHAHDSLEVYVPITDLIWPDVFPLMMRDVKRAVLLPKELIDGRPCNHLAFDRPDVQFQIWVADSGAPLPCKYIVTDPGTPALLSIVTTLTNWNVAPTVPADYFSFTPPAGAKKVEFRDFPQFN
jgi:hypothetical protein